ncbi:MAG TPA: ABC transporter permease [Bryobacteraceae bacterium]|nr:ABC transporter permease [Bryobacteraceae bacterium]
MASKMQLKLGLFALLLDIRYSVRQFVRSPGVSLTLLLTIALGIGSNVAIHGFVQGGFFQGATPASFSRVVSIFARDLHREAGPLSFRQYLEIQSHREAFEWVAAARITPRTVILNGQSTVLSIGYVTPDLASFFNLSFASGVLLSQHAWENEFGADNRIRGQKIRIDGEDLTIGGVAPDGLEGVYRDRAVDLWMPLPSTANQNVWVLGRLRHRAIPALPPDIRMLPYTGVTPAIAAGRARVASLLNYAGLLVFFIACANVASFLVGRATSRARETSLRIALGASRGQLIRGLLADSIVMSVAGGALGSLLALWTTWVLPALLFEEDAQRLVFAPDLFGVAAASAACIGITIACGLLPVFTISHHRPADVLRRESAGPSIGIRRLRMGLVIAQMMSCCVLVISTAFLFAGLKGALASSAGQRMRHPILVNVLASPMAGIGYFQGVQRAAQSIPDVSTKAWVGRLPGSLAAWASFRVEPRQTPLRDVGLTVAPFTSASLALFQLPPAEGRLFNASDQACRVAVVNEQAAKVLFGHGTVGRTVRDSANSPIEIVGILAMRNAGSAAPTIYFHQLDATGPNNERPGLAKFRAPADSALQQIELDSNVVSQDYFAAMGWPLVAGTAFIGGPKQTACRIAVINREANDLYFGGNAIGASVIDDIGRRTEIVGVVNAQGLATFERSMEPAIYFPMTQDFLPYMTLILNVQTSNQRTLETLRASIDAVPGRGPAPVLVRTLDTYISQTALAPLRIATMIIGASSTIAMLLGIFGLFGALSDAVRQRRREFAMRIALGAKRRHVIWQVLKEGGRLAFAGTAAGTLGSLVLAGTLSQIVPGNTLPTAWIWLAAPLLLGISVVIASVVPSRRALILNPLVILRDNN